MLNSYVFSLFVFFYLIFFLIENASLLEITCMFGICLTRFCFAKGWCEINVNADFRF